VCARDRLLLAQYSESERLFIAKVLVNCKCKAQRRQTEGINAADTLSRVGVGLRRRLCTKTVNGVSGSHLNCVVWFVQIRPYKSQNLHYII